MFTAFLEGERGRNRFKSTSLVQYAKNLCVFKKNMDIVPVKGLKALN